MGGSPGDARPGVNLASALPGGGYALVSSTSFAIPVMSGALALAQLVNKASVGPLARQLNATGTTIDSANPTLLKGDDTPLGHGLLNVQAFMQSLR